MNQRGQFAIVSILAVMVVLLVLAPIVLQIVKTSVGGVADNLQSVSPLASAQVSAVENKFVGMWDYIIMFMFLFNVVLLLISSFFIDTHPIFLIVYIFVSFLMFLFAPYLIDTAERVWESPYFVAENTAGHLTMTSFLLDNFSMVLLMIYVISGIIIYGKIKLFGNNYGS